tara:strand:+ start:352 stop:561 length:210 start_codon:yes stop_codon:yes gene_type:complete
LNTLTVIKSFIEEPDDAPHVMEFVGANINQCLRACSIYVEGQPPGTKAIYHSHRVITEDQFHTIGESKK